MANSFTLVILHNNFGPYHMARLEAINRYGRRFGVSVEGIETASQMRIYPWKIRGDGGKGQKVTLFSGKAYEEIPLRDMMRAMWSTLNEINPQALAICGYKQVEMLTALAWARIKKRLAILVMDSKYDDYARSRLKEWVKRRAVSLFDTALVSGTYSQEYATFLGMSPDRIFTGCDVVDNEYFADQADRARKNASHFRKEYQLPEHYFLCVSRFVNGKGKNISRLLEAYARYCQESQRNPWDLVLCGSGPLESQLRKEAELLRLNQVHFAGFRQLDELTIYYGLAHCLIIPSLGDTWSLAVNEAMATGLPVLVSRACGCVPNLVQDGVNGYAFDPYNVDGMIQLMLQMSSSQVNLAAMGKASRQLIANWSLETYCYNLMQAAAVAPRRRWLLSKAENNDKK